ncbi:hypothetical protein WI36_12175 [Burkholderia ubonensis]|nr:hypothetical protein WI36_12175 [Burkholderia ubonensis]
MGFPTGKAHLLDCVTQAHAQKVTIGMIFMAPLLTRPMRDKQMQHGVVVTQAKIYPLTYLQRARALH